VRSRPHAGAGTTTEAARAGVPQVVVPRFGDQPYWAHRVAALGIGTSVPFAALSAETLAAALTSVCEPGHAARAASMAAKVASDGGGRGAPWSRWWNDAAERRGTIR